MAATFDRKTMQRYRADPAAFITEVLVNPETGKAFKLLAAERQFLAHAFKTDDDGALLYPEQIYGCPKKSGKTGFAAMYTITLMIYGGAYPEAICAANDLDQSTGRVFLMIRRIIERSRLLARRRQVHCRQDHARRRDHHRHPVRLRQRRGGQQSEPRGVRRALGFRQRARAPLV